MTKLLKQQKAAKQKAARKLRSEAAKGILVIACNDTQSHDRGVMTAMRLRNKSAMTLKGLTIVERIAVPFRHSVMTEQVNNHSTNRAAKQLGSEAAKSKNVNNHSTVQPFNHSTERKAAFTLAEVLITLTVIGIVAALTIPTLMKNYQEKAEREQVRMVKYKLTQATSVMNTYGLIGRYNTTKDFVDELQKYMKLTKICDNNNLAACWPTSTINIPNSSDNPDGFKAESVSGLTDGTAISSLGLGTASTKTMGIVFADGTPMILTYSPQCTPLDPYRNYNYSFTDNKPVTNATTNCISAIFDINGSKGPNRIGKDVRTLNSLFGYAKFGATSVTKAECEQMKSKGLVNDCSEDPDFWAGAVKKCNDIGLHLPDPQTLANIAGAYYGRTDIGSYTTIAKSDSTFEYNCDFFNKEGEIRNTRGNVICENVTEFLPSSSSVVSSLSGLFWSASEVSPSKSYARDIVSDGSYWNESNRFDDHVPLCVGD